MCADVWLMCTDARLMRGQSNTIEVSVETVTTQENKVAFAVVFPGQGSQSVGMLADLSERYDAVKTTFAEAADHLDVDLWHLAQTGPAEKLSDTRITQPLMFTAGVAVWRCLQAEGLAMPSWAWMMMRCTICVCR